MPYRLLLLAGVLLLVALVWAFPWQRGAVEAPAAAEADPAQLLQAGDFAGAESAALQRLVTQPHDSDLRLIAAEAASRLAEFERALDQYEAIDDADPNAAVARVATGEIQRSRGELSAAIAAFERAVRLSPEIPVARDRLGLLLRIVGRPRAAQPHLVALIETGAWRPEHLCWLASSAHVLNVDDLLNGCRAASPADAAPLEGLAALGLARGQATESLALLEEARDLDRQSATLAAQQGLALLQTDAADWTSWQRGLPTDAALQPDIWYVHGVLADRAGDVSAAQTCWARALQLDNDHLPALHGLARSLVAAGETDQAAPLARRAELLARVDSVTSNINPQRPSLAACQSLAELMSSLDRAVEAEGWRLLAVSQGADPATLLEQPTAPEQRAAAQAVVAGLCTGDPRWPDLAAYGLPGGLQRPAPALADAESRFRFEDVAADVGLDFRYFESPDESTEGRRMFEWTGGGVAALDFDQDGWPDLYFTQGTRLPIGSAGDEFQDQLFRNRRGMAFDNVTNGSCLSEPNFSQGVSAGDFDNDGFPDLYVANIGGNRLFRNNGDGTFVEVPLPEPESGATWTTSCAMADVNGDGWPDLYDVNYVWGPGIESLICRTDAGPRACSPLAFTGRPDRLLLNSADGTFVDVSTDSGIALPAGRGLGIVAANFDDDPALELFIANDMVANNLFDNEAEPGENPRFVDRALTAGLAFGADGAPQACMGVAVADFNGDGRSDLLVTNFANEPNACYVSQGGGLFKDEAATRGLSRPSLPLLGFGTQPLDADHDGDLDIVVTNGDLDDFSHENRALRMPSQLFENRDGTFLLQHAGTPDDYFARENVSRGRGLATLDWNRDGRPDFAVSNLDDPAALVTNRTTSEGGWIGLRLVGRTGARDAIGAQVAVRAADNEQVRTVAAGDGYQSSNGRMILIGGLAGPADITIRWPVGATGTWTSLAPGRAYILVEDAARPLPIESD